LGYGWGKVGQGGASQKHLLKNITTAGSGGGEWWASMEIDENSLPQLAPPCPKSPRRIYRSFIT